MAIYIHLPATPRKQPVKAKDGAKEWTSKYGPETVLSSGDRFCEGYVKRLGKGRFAAAVYEKGKSFPTWEQTSFSSIHAAGIAVDKEMHRISSPLWAKERAKDAEPSFAERQKLMQEKSNRETFETALSNVKRIAAAADFPGRKARLASAKKFVRELASQGYGKLPSDFNSSDAGFDRREYSPREYNRLTDEIKEIEAQIKVVKGGAIPKRDLQQVLAKLKAERAKYRTDDASVGEHEKARELSKQAEEASTLAGKQGSPRNHKVASEKHYAASMVWENIVKTAEGQEKRNAEGRVRSHREKSDFHHRNSIN